MNGYFAYEIENIISISLVGDTIICCLQFNYHFKILDWYWGTIQGVQTALFEEDNKQQVIAPFYHTNFNLKQIASTKLKLDAGVTELNYQKILYSKFLLIVATTTEFCTIL